MVFQFTCILKIKSMVHVRFLNCHNLVLILILLSTWKWGTRAHRVRISDFGQGTLQCSVCLFFVQWVMNGMVFFFNLTLIFSADLLFTFWVVLNDYLSSADLQNRLSKMFRECHQSI